MLRKCVTTSLALGLLVLPSMGGRALAEHQSLSPPSSTDQTLGAPSTDEDSSGSASIPETDNNGGGPQRLMGQIMALNTDTGQVLLKTKAGMLALQGTPEEVQKLNVGDVIVVELREGAEAPSSR